MHIRNVCMLGGTGFVGGHIANRLAAPQERAHTRVLTRHYEPAKHLLVIPNLRLYQADIFDEEQLVRHFRGCDAVINLVGILNEPGRGAFQRVHAELPELVARACKRAGVKRLLHMSALGASRDAPSRYLQSKAEGEERVHAAAHEELLVTSFRPSVIFGPEDSFFNRFKGLLRKAPGMFPLPTPNARFSPVYVGDVAEAFMRTLADPHRAGQRLELCGPRTYSLRELVEYTARTAGIERRSWAMGDGMSRLQAHLLGVLPGKPYSYDNYLSATVDNVCTHNALPDLGIKPTGIEAIVPGYLAGINSKGNYFRFRQAASRERSHLHKGGSH